MSARTTDATWCPKHGLQLVVGVEESLPWSGSDATTVTARLECNCRSIFVGHVDDWPACRRRTRLTP